MYQGTEFVWLACALVFLGSFGLGNTLVEIMRRRKAQAIVVKDEER